MKRFSKVVRHPHKLTQWSAGSRNEADKNKKKTKVLFCEEKRISLNRLSSKEQDVAHLQSLQVAWYDLKKVNESVETLMSVLEVLLKSCVNPCECLHQGALLQGDIRAELCDKKLTCKILLKLSKYWDKALSMMKLDDQTYYALKKYNPQDTGKISVELLRLFGWTSKLEDEEISSFHLAVLMPWLSSHDNLTARIFCDDWERVPNALTGQVLFAACHPDSLRSWLDTMLTLDVEKGEYLLFELLDNGVDTKVVKDNIAPMISFAFYQTYKLNIEHRADRFISYLLNGMSVARLRCLLELEVHIKDRAEESWYREEGVEDFSVIQPFLKYLNNEEAIDLWASKLSSTKWKEIGERLEHHRLDDSASKFFLSLMRKQGSYLNCDGKAWFWFMDASAEAFNSIDQKFYKKLENLLYYQFNSGETLDKWKQMLKMILIVCSDKMSTQSEIDVILSKIEGESVEEMFIQKLKYRAWQHLDHYCRSDNKSERLEKGLERFFSNDRSFIPTIIRGLNSSPSITLEAITKLGTLPEQQYQSIFKWLEYHPLYAMDQTNIKQRCSMLEYLSHDLKDLDLPRKIFKHLDQGKRIESLRKEILDKEMLSMERAEMRILFLAIDEYLTGILGDKADKHSVIMINTASSNRRGGRRALKKHQKRGESARLLHPSNISWLRKPKSFWRPGVWIKGVYKSEEIASIGKITIQTESRFDEILKMGTYVDSCLSIGGCNQHSAIANALDANKRVLFMYDENGKFLARQLLAITKDRKLACFQVYHASHTHDKKIIEQCFARIDHEFCLGLGLTIQEEHEYEIEHVVCRDWYDDGIWIPRIEEESA